MISNCKYLAYRRCGYPNTGYFDTSETGESTHTFPSAFGIVVLADGTSHVGGTASFPKDVIATGSVTLIGTGIRIWPGVIGTVKGLDVSCSMNDSHWFPYLAGRRRVIIVLLGLATSLIDDLTATSYGNFFLRHDGRFYTQGCLESHRGPL